MKTLTFLFILLVLAAMSLDSCQMAKPHYTINHPRTWHPHENGGGEVVRE